MLGGIVLKIMTRVMPVILSAALIILAGCGDEDQEFPNPLQIEVSMLEGETETASMPEEELPTVGNITGRIIFTDSDNQIQAYALSSNEYVILQGSTTKVSGKKISLFVDFPSNNSTYLMEGGYFQITDVEPGTHELILVRATDAIIAAEDGLLPEDSYLKIDVPACEWAVTVETDRNTTMGSLIVPVSDMGLDSEWKSGTTGHEVVIPQEPEEPTEQPTKPTSKPVVGDWETAVVVTSDTIHEQQASVTQDGSTFTIKAGGHDIWGEADQFTFVYQEWSGDFELVVTVHSLENTNEWSKSGPMARQSVEPGSTNVFAACRGADELVTFQRRSALNGASASERITPDGAPRPVTIKLTREGNTFYGGWSLDGGRTWEDSVSNDGVTPTSPVNLTMIDPILIGIAVTSHQEGVITTSEVEVVSAPFVMAVEPVGKLAAKWSELKVH